MTILNETTNFKKYNTLKYVEFLEMVCRVAIVIAEKGDDSAKSLEYKVESLLIMIFHKLRHSECGSFSSERGGKDLKFIELDPDHSCDEDHAPK